MFSFLCNASEIGVICLKFIVKVEFTLEFFNSYNPCTWYKWTVMLNLDQAPEGLNLFSWDRGRICGLQ